MERKGFPESFDTKALLSFLAAVKSGEYNVSAPVYSHFHYDIVPEERKRVEQPDILIVEGLNVLQPARLPQDGDAIPYVSDFFDFSIYMDADSAIIEQWYVTRFLKLRKTAFTNPEAYFHRYSSLTDDRRGRVHRNLANHQPAKLACEHFADTVKGTFDFAKRRGSSYRKRGAQKL